MLMIKFLQAQIYMKFGILRLFFTQFKMKYLGDFKYFLGF